MFVGGIELFRIDQSSHTIFLSIFGEEPFVHLFQVNHKQTRTKFTTEKNKTIKNIVYDVTFNSLQRETHFERVSFRS